MATVGCPGQRFWRSPGSAILVANNEKNWSLRPEERRRKQSPERVAVSLERLELGNSTRGDRYSPVVLSGKA